MERRQGKDDRRKRWDGRDYPSVKDERSHPVSDRRKSERRGLDRRVIDTNRVYFGGKQRRSGKERRQQ